MNLLYTDIEESLPSSVRDLLTSRCTPSAVMAAYDGDRSLTAPLWRSLGVDLGLAGLLVAEERGGSGGSAREAAVVLEELGGHAAPVPFLTSAVLATAALAGCDDGLVAELASGAVTGTLGVPLSTAPFAFTATVRAGSGGLQGSVTSVAGALDADVVLIPVSTDDGTELHVVDIGVVCVEPVVSLDMTRPLADLRLDGVDSRVLLSCDQGDGAVRDALVLGAALLASEQVGVATWCLGTTVAYVKERRQFGRVVGGFQALKHRLADLYVAVESARAAARYAAAAWAQGDPDAEISASLAQSYCADVAVRAAQECVQLHGGIGMTWEHPAHLYLKRAKADQLAFGTPAAHRLRLSELVDLPVHSVERIHS